MQQSDSSRPPAILRAASGVNYTGDLLYLSPLEVPVQITVEVHFNNPSPFLFAAVEQPSDGTVSLISVALSGPQMARSGTQSFAPFKTVTTFNQIYGQPYGILGTALPTPALSFVGLDGATPDLGYYADLPWLQAGEQAVAVLNSIIFYASIVITAGPSGSRLLIADVKPEMLATGQPAMMNSYLLQTPEAGMVFLAGVDAPARITPTNPYNDTYWLAFGSPTTSNVFLQRVATDGTFHLVVRDWYMLDAAYGFDPAVPFALQTDYFSFLYITAADRVTGGAVISRLRMWNSTNTSADIGTQSFAYAPSPGMNLWAVARPPSWSLNTMIYEGIDVLESADATSTSAMTVNRLWDARASPVRTDRFSLCPGDVASQGVLDGAEGYGYYVTGGGWAVKLALSSALVVQIRLLVGTAAPQVPVSAAFTFLTPTDLVVIDNPKTATPVAYRVPRGSFGSTQAVAVSVARPFYGGAAVPDIAHGTVYFFDSTQTYNPSAPYTIYFILHPVNVTAGSNFGRAAADINLPTPYVATSAPAFIVIAAATMVVSPSLAYGLVTSTTDTGFALMVIRMASAGMSLVSGGHLNANLPIGGVRSVVANPSSGCFFLLASPAGGSATYLFRLNTSTWLIDPLSASPSIWAGGVAPPAAAAADAPFVISDYVGFPFSQLGFLYLARDPSMLQWTATQVSPNVTGAVLSLVDTTRNASYVNTGAGAARPAAVVVRDLNPFLNTPPTPSGTPTPSITPSASITASGSGTVTSSLTTTPSTGASASITATGTLSASASVSASPSTSMAASVSGSLPGSPSVSGSASPSLSPVSATASASLSASLSLSGSVTRSAAGSVSASIPASSPGPTASGSVAASVSASPSMQASANATHSGTPSASAPPPSPTPAATPTATPLPMTVNCSSNATWQQRYLVRLEVALRLPVALPAPPAGGSASPGAFGAGALNATAADAWACVWQQLLAQVGDGAASAAAQALALSAGPPPHSAAPLLSVLYDASPAAPLGALVNASALSPCAVPPRQTAQSTLASLAALLWANATRAATAAAGLSNTTLPPAGWPAIGRALLPASFWGVWQWFAGAAAASVPAPPSDSAPYANPAVLAESFVAAAAARAAWQPGAVLASPAAQYPVAAALAPALNATYLSLQGFLDPGLSVGAGCMAAANATAGGALGSAVPVPPYVVAFYQQAMGGCARAYINGTGAALPLPPPAGSAAALADPFPLLSCRSVALITIDGGDMPGAAFVAALVPAQPPEAPASAPGSNVIPDGPGGPGGESVNLGLIAGIILLLLLLLLLLLCCLRYCSLLGVARLRYRRKAHRTLTRVTAGERALTLLAAGGIDRSPAAIVDMLSVSVAQRLTVDAEEEAASGGAPPQSSDVTMIAADGSLVKPLAGTAAGPGARSKRESVVSLRQPRLREGRAQFGQMLIGAPLGGSAGGDAAGGAAVEAADDDPAPVSARPASRAAGATVRNPLAQAAAVLDGAGRADFASMPTDAPGELVEGDGDAGSAFQRRSRPSDIAQRRPQGGKGRSQFAGGTTAGDDDIPGSGGEDGQQAPDASDEAAAGQRRSRPSDFGQRKPGAGKGRTQFAAGLAADSSDPLALPSHPFGAPPPPPPDPQGPQRHLAEADDADAGPRSDLQRRARPSYLGQRLPGASKSRRQFGQAAPAALAPSAEELASADAIVGAFASASASAPAVGDLHPEAGDGAAEPAPVRLARRKSKAMCVLSAALPPAAIKAAVAASLAAAHEVAAAAPWEQAELARWGDRWDDEGDGGVEALEGVTMEEGGADAGAEGCEASGAAATASGPAGGAPGSPSPGSPMLRPRAASRKSDVGLRQSDNATRRRQSTRSGFNAPGARAGAARVPGGRASLAPQQVLRLMVDAAVKSVRDVLADELEEGQLAELLQQTEGPCAAFTDGWTAGAADSDAALPAGTIVPLREHLQAISSTLGVEEGADGTALAAAADSGAPAPHLPGSEALGAGGAEGRVRPPADEGGRRPHPLKKQFTWVRSMRDSIETRVAAADQRRQSMLLPGQGGAQRAAGTAGRRASLAVSGGLGGPVSTARVRPADVGASGGAGGDDEEETRVRFAASRSPSPLALVEEGETEGAAAERAEAMLGADSGGDGPASSGAAAAGKHGSPVLTFTRAHAAGDVSAFKGGLAGARQAASVQAASRPVAAAVVAEGGGQRRRSSLLGRCTMEALVLCSLGLEAERTAEALADALQASDGGAARAVQEASSVAKRALLGGSKSEPSLLPRSAGFAATASTANPALAGGREFEMTSSGLGRSLRKLDTAGKAPVHISALDRAAQLRRTASDPSSQLGVKLSLMQVGVPPAEAAEIAAAAAEGAAGNAGAAAAAEHLAAAACSMHAFAAQADTDARKQAWGGLFKCTPRGRRGSVLGSGGGLDDGHITIPGSNPALAGGKAAQGGVRSLVLDFLARRRLNGALASGQMAAAPNLRRGSLAKGPGTPLLTAGTRSSNRAAMPPMTAGGEGKAGAPPVARSIRVLPLDFAADRGFSRLPGPAAGGHAQLSNPLFGSESAAGRRPASCRAGGEEGGGDQGDEVAASRRQARPSLEKIETGGLPERVRGVSTSPKSLRTIGGHLKEGRRISRRL